MKTWECHHCTAFTRVQEPCSPVLNVLPMEPSRHQVLPFNEVCGSIRAHDDPHCVPTANDAGVAGPRLQVWMLIHAERRWVEPQAGVTGAHPEVAARKRALISNDDTAALYRFRNPAAHAAAPGAPRPHHETGPGDGQEVLSFKAFTVEVEARQPPEMRPCSQGAPSIMGCKCRDLFHNNNLSSRPLGEDRQQDQRERPGIVVASLMPSSRPGLARW